MRSTTKSVVNQIQEHVLNHFTEDYGWEVGTPETNLRDQIESMAYPNESVYQTAKRWVEGGSALVYYGEQREFLDSLDINPKNKTFTDQQVFDTYVALLAREITKLVEVKE